MKDISKTEIPYGCSCIKNIRSTHGGLEYVIQTANRKFTITAADFRRIGEDVLAEDNFIDSDTVYDLEFSSEKLSCIQKSLNFLEYSSMPERKLRMKLHGKFSKEAIDAALEILKENDYINDSRLAEDLCEEYFRNCRMSPAMIKAKLYQRGFSRETVSILFEEYEFDEETIYDNMTELLESKFGYEIDKEEKRKALEFLVRKGYSYEDAKSCINNIY